MLKNQLRTPTLLQLRGQHVPRGVPNMHPIFIAHAQGAQLWDIDGNEYLDFAGGIGVLNVGHNHPKVMQTLQAQLECFSHTCFQVAMYEPFWQPMGTPRYNCSRRSHDGFVPIPGPARSSIPTGSRSSRDKKASNWKCPKKPSWPTSTAPAPGPCGKRSISPWVRATRD